MNSRYSGIVTGCLLIGLAFGRFFGCSSGTNDADKPAATRNYDVDKLLTTNAKVISQTYDDARWAGFGLSQMVEALNPENGVPLLSVLKLSRDRFTELMAVWQRLELMQIGPAGSKTTVSGGKDLRDEIYSWPTTNPCLIDQMIVSKAYTEADFFEKQLVNVYGLDALEYLLFYDGPDNQCASQSSINEGTGGARQKWSSLSADDLSRRRAAYAEVLTTEISQQIAKLYESWKTDGGSAYNDLLNAGDGSSPYASTTKALNDLTHAIFYIEEVTKDKKLGEPGGLCVACTQPTWEAGLESRWAGLSAENIYQNLLGFAHLYLGNTDGDVDKASEGSFDTQLRIMGEQDIADNIVETLKKALDIAAAVEKPLLDKLASQDNSDVKTLYDAIKDLADLLKGDFATVLLLEVPAEAASDAD